MKEIKQQSRIHWPKTKLSAESAYSSLSSETQSTGVRRDDDWSAICFNHIIDTGRCSRAVTLLYVCHAHGLLVVHHQLFTITMNLLHLKINDLDVTYTSLMAGINTVFNNNVNDDMKHFGAGGASHLQRITTRLCSSSLLYGPWIAALCFTVRPCSFNVSDHSRSSCNAILSCAGQQIALINPLHYLQSTKWQVDTVSNEL